MIILFLLIFESFWLIVDLFGFMFGIVSSVGVFSFFASLKFNVFDNCLSIDGCFLNMCMLCFIIIIVVFSVVVFICVVIVLFSSVFGFNRFVVFTKRLMSVYSFVLFEYVDVKFFSVIC